MVVRDPRLKLLAIRPAEASGMRELQTHHQAVYRTECLLVGGDPLLQERPPPRRPRSAPRRSSQNSASGGASVHSASHRDSRPSPPSDECTSGCRLLADQSESAPPAASLPPPSAPHHPPAAPAPAPPAARERRRRSLAGQFWDSQTYGDSNKPRSRQI